MIWDFDKAEGKLCGALVWSFDDNKLTGFELVPKVIAEVKLLGVCKKSAGLSDGSVFIYMYYKQVWEGIELDAAGLAAEGAAAAGKAKM